jgi:hypothetical protein
LGRGYEFIRHQDAKSQNANCDDAKFLRGGGVDEDGEEDDDDENDDESDDESDSESDIVLKAKKITKEDLVSRWFQYCSYVFDSIYTYIFLLLPWLLFF